MEDTESEKHMHNEAERESELASGNSSPEERTLREIFDRDKAAALEHVKWLSELIPDIALDGDFEDGGATDENRPMRTLALAKGLCAALENLECLKLVIAKEVYV